MTTILQLNYLHKTSAYMLLHNLNMFACLILSFGPDFIVILLFHSFVHISSVVNIVQRKAYSHFALLVTSCFSPKHFNIWHPMKNWLEWLMDHRNSYYWTLKYFPSFLKHKPVYSSYIITYLTPVDHKTLKLVWYLSFNQ